MPTSLGEGGGGMWVKIKEIEIKGIWSTFSVPDLNKALSQPDQVRILLPCFDLKDPNNSLFCLDLELVTVQPLLKTFNDKSSFFPRQVTMLASSQH